jgi:hypothetical protein
MSLDDKHLDELLSQPFPSVADEGFSVRTMRRILADYRRMQLLMWGLILLGMLPVLIAFPLADWGIRLAGDAAHALTSPALSYVAGALVLAWVWKPRFYTR